MLFTCYYYDEIRKTYFKTDYHSIVGLEKTDPAEFLRRKSNLYRREDGKIPMVLVRNGIHHGFRRKGNTGGNNADHYRGEYESLSHQGNKEVLSKLDQLQLSFGDEKVTLFIEYSECEKAVICNGNRYEVDIYFKLERTDPAEYYDRWGGELWFEVFHTCKVDKKQAEDFNIENKTLFEFKIPDSFSFFDNITEEGYAKRQEFLKDKYSDNGVKGLLICQKHGDKACIWKRSINGNMTARIGDSNFTVIKSKFGTNYGIMYGNGLQKWEYNQQRFETEEAAMKTAEYFAFLLYNNVKIN